MNTQSAQLAHRVAQIEHADHLARAAEIRRRRSATTASKSLRPRRRRLLAIGVLLTGAIVGVGTKAADAWPVIDRDRLAAFHSVERCDYRPTASQVVGSRFIRAV